MIINLCGLCCVSQKFKKYFEQTISIIGLKMCHCDTVGKKKKNTISLNFQYLLSLYCTCILVYYHRTSYLSGFSLVLLINGILGINMNALSIIQVNIL